MSTRKLTIERIYLITSLSVFDATCTELATWIRGHWGIENLLHHVRHRTFREDDITVTPFRPLAAFTPRVVSSLLGGPLRHWTRSLWPLASGPSPPSTRPCRPPPDRDRLPT
ncbi:hypothetical protein ACFWPQ_38880 [Streptomyces sp. NPDC058464]|uniref:hypothetical protein n=1 Tax=Streptomyces sp. NPDC058464 TaxID=3346511 RepID=UPI003656F370